MTNGENRTTITPPANGISDASRRVWEEWRFKETQLRENSAERDRLLKERDAAHAELVRLGKEEGWHL